MAKKSKYLVIGHFEFLDDTLSVIKKAKADQRDYEVFSGFPNHDLEDEIYEGKRRSPVRLIVLIGAITGCLGGFLMTSWMSQDWPIRTSAKGILSFPAFVVIAFECTILLGAIANITSMFHFSRIPMPFPNKGHRKPFSSGTFGVSIKVEKEDTEKIEAELRDMGASQVEVQYVR